MLDSFHLQTLEPLLTRLRWVGYKQHSTRNRRTPASPGLGTCGEQDVPLEEALSSHRGMTSVLGVSEDLWHLSKNRAIHDREPLSLSTLL